MTYLKLLKYNSVKYYFWDTVRKLFFARRLERTFLNALYVATISFPGMDNNICEKWFGLRYVFKKI